MQVIERETFESALLLGRRVLVEGLGHNAYRIRQAAFKFRKYTLQTLLAAYPYYKDRDAFTSVARRGREQLEEQIRRDRSASEGDEARDWD